MERTIVILVVVGIVGLCAVATPTTAVETEQNVGPGACVKFATDPVGVQVDPAACIPPPVGDILP
jgi:hypothetical protein